MSNRIEELKGIVEEGLSPGGSYTDASDALYELVREASQAIMAAPLLREGLARSQAKLRAGFPTPDEYDTYLKTYYANAGEFPNFVQVYEFITRQGA